jgi:hypothetical protein
MRWDRGCCFIQRTMDEQALQIQASQRFAVFSE